MITDLESLRCVLAVADTLSFRAAAARVGLSPAAVSDRVKRVEEELGTSLFERTTRRVAISDAGRRLVPHARELLDDAARCRAVARGDDTPLPFELTLGTRYELGLSWLVPGLPSLEASRPERTLHLYMGDTAALLTRLERGAIDGAVLSARLNRPHIRAALLHEEGYAFVTASEGPTTAAEAARFTLIDVTPDLPLFRYLVDVLPPAPAWRFASHRYLGGISAIRQEVLAGRGVAVLPRYFVEPQLACGELVELMPDRPPAGDWFRLLWRADHPKEGELERLAHELRERPLE